MDPQALRHSRRFRLNSADLKTWTDYPGLTISGTASVVWPLSTGPRYFFRLMKL